jgi:tetratricopeptide (TPR) repeat protein
MVQDSSQNVGEITTNTIAELYIKQGYLDKALDIYRAILEIDPANAAASTKVKEVEAMMSGTEVSEAQDASLDVPGVLAIESQVARLESWLAVIQEMRGGN